MFLLRRRKLKNYRLSIHLKAIEKGKLKEQRVGINEIESKYT